jgi:hypothetical protein
LEKAEQEALLADLIDGEAARFARIQEGINQIYATINQNNSKEQDEDLALLEQQYKKGLITYEEYERKRALIKAEYARRILGNELAMLEAQRAANIADGKSVIDIDKAIYAAKEALRQSDVDSHKAANQKKVDDDKKKAAEREEIEKQVKAAVMQIAQEGLNAIFESGNAQRAAALENRLAELETAKQAELDNKNLTEQQKSDIDKKYKAKERIEKIKAFEAEKDAKRSQAIINGLLGVTNALATAPTIIAGVILAAVVAATTAIQVAKINSTPVPKFRHGKVGIEGPSKISCRLSANRFVFPGILFSCLRILIPSVTISKDPHPSAAWLYGWLSVLPKYSL